MAQLIPESRGNRQAILLLAISLALAGCGGKGQSSSNARSDSATHGISARPSAESEANASGTVRRVGPPVVREFDGFDREGNRVTQRTVHREIDGSITGTVLERSTAIVDASGAIRVSGVDICSPCSFAGRSGGLLFDLEASGPRATFVSEGRLTIIAASGDLVGLAGELTFTGHPANLTYQGELTFRED